jgi:hypothetical protein
LSRNKKKKKIAGQNLSLTERLARHWDNEKWESFFTLYMRDRGASERGPWAARFPDALYNCLSATLFLHKNHDGARQVAEMMLAERALGSDDAVLRECARTVLDFLNIREGKSNHPSEREGRDIVIPEPYGELRRKLEDAFTHPKRRGKGKDISNPTVEKLAKQFKALPSAKNNTPYTSFLNTAEALASETDKSGSAVIFRTVRDIASIMREVARGSLGFNDPSHVIRRFNSKDYPIRTIHPALLTMWEYMCGLGGRKFGERWENAMRAGRMSVVFMGEEFKPAYDKLINAGENFSSVSGPNLPITAERNFDGWTEQERFILIFLAVSAYLTRNGPDFFDGIPANTILRYFKTLGELGGRIRSEGAWPQTVRFVFEKIAVRGAGYFDLMIGEDLPYECMTAVTIILMVLYSPHTLKFLKDKLKSRLPLELSVSDMNALDNFFPGVVFSVPVLAAASDLLDREGKEIFFKFVLMSVIRTDISRTLEAAHRPALWNSVSKSHFALFLENLPDDSFAAAFCRLCVGQKPMSLSGDTSLIAAFFSSRPENSLFNSTLSLFLMTWPGVSAEFLLRLFELSLDEHEQIDEWQAIPKIISKIQNPNDMKNIALGISRILKRRYRYNMSADVRRAVKYLGALEKSARLPEEDDDFLDDFDGNLMRFAERFTGKKKRR